MRVRILMAVGALLIFGTVNWQIAGKERLRAGGKVVFLALAPRDPRSLMQGDYMALNFAVARGVSSDLSGKPDSGSDGTHAAILKLNERRVGDFVRLDDSKALGPDEMRFKFRIRTGGVWLGTNAFFFHEGEEQRYAAARFGEFRVNDDGDAMLVDVRDQNLNKM